MQLFLHNNANRLFHNVLLILWPLYRKLSKLLVYSLNQHSQGDSMCESETTGPIDQ